MITIPEKVEQIINQSPYLREAIADKLINLSALARKLQPQVEQELIKDATEGSILIALQRYSRDITPHYAVNPAKFIGSIGLKPDLCELTLKKTPTITKLLANIAEQNNARPDTFIYTQGQYQVSVITSRNIRREILQNVREEDIIKDIDDLSAIILQRTPGQVERTGVLYYPLRILAWENISAVQIITNLDEMMILIKDTDSDRAFTSIRQSLKNSQ